MMKKVYICAPLGGDVQGDLEKAKRIAQYALKCGTAPVGYTAYRGASGPGRSARTTGSENSGCCGRAAASTAAGTGGSPARGG